MTSTAGGGLVFSPEALKGYVAAELAKLPEGKRGALVSYYTLDGRWKMSVVQRLGTSWQLGATVERDLARGIQGGLLISGVW